MKPFSPNSGAGQKTLPQSLQQAQGLDRYTLMHQTLQSSFHRHSASCGCGKEIEEMDKLLERRRRFLAGKILFKKDSTKVAQFPDPKSSPDEEAVGDTKTAGERGRAFAAERRRKQAQALAPSEAAAAKGMEKSLRNGKRRVFGNKLRKTMFRGAEKRVFLLLPIGENREPTTDAKCRCGSIFSRGGQKTDLSKFEWCLFCRLGKKKRTLLRKTDRVQLFLELN